MVKAKKSGRPKAPARKKKIAILGGGAASLAAAYGLTSEPGWSDRYEVTVYSLGWRLGGKGATGRNPAQGHRIEEHGLHMWFGFYDNAFAMMREVFRELNRPKSHPLPDFERAFLGQNIYAMEQEFKGQWYHWDVYMPPNDRRPGDFRPLTLWDYLEEAVRLLEHLIIGRFPKGNEASAATPEPFPELHGLWDEVVEGAKELLDKAADIVTKAADPVQLIGKVLALVSSPEARQASGAAARGHPVIVRLIRGTLELIKGLLGDSVENDLEAYRFWLLVDMLGTIICGALTDDLVHRGTASINDRDWEEWLVAHGLSEITRRSCLVQVGYDSSFAFFKGRFNMEAGTMLSGAMRLYLDYKGSLVYRFAAGTGETVFEPLYQCLKARGVRFEFFTKVTEIVSRGDQIETIRFERQARPIAAEYDPFITVKGLACWPSEPKYELLVEGEELRRSKANLESYWTTWQGKPEELRLGVDFDECILGISIAALPALTPTLQAASKSWRLMLENIKTTRTQAFQLWLKPTLRGLGWPFDEAIISCNGEPLDSWADLSCTLPFEDWSGSKDQEPASVEYFCGAIVQEPDVIPPPTDRGYPEQQKALAKQGALEYIYNKLERTWPKAFQGGVFQWQLLVDAQGGPVGEARFDSQWYKANIDPSERYVLSVRGSSRYRLKSDGTDFKNLFIAGDWTDNGVVNAGCMEAAVISGLQAARALTGCPRVIAGEEVFGAEPLGRAS